MKGCTRILLGLYLGALVGLASAPASAGGRIALVIGNSAYRNVTRLPNPVNDSEAVAKMLEAANFEVAAHHDLGVDAMRRAVRDFAVAAQNAEIAVVFYAGHGMEIDGNNYLIPVDATLEWDVDIHDQAISLDRVLKSLDAAKRLRLVILDACRDNPFVASMKRTVVTRSIGRGLAEIQPDASDTLIAFAAKAGSTAADGAGSHSPFTAALLRHLPVPGLDLRFALGRVRDDVLKATQSRQEPFLYGSLGGDPVSIVPPRADEGQPDQVAWRLLADSREITQLQRFAREFPTSPFRVQANERIAMLTAEQNRREMGRTLQQELKRVGCFQDRIDGEFDEATRNALQRFVKYSSLALASEGLSTETINAVRGFKGRACPLSCGAGERLVGDRCIALSKNPAEPAHATKKCFTLQGRQFCE